MFERFTERARSTVARAQHEARGLGHARIGTEHLLLAMTRDDEGVAALVLGRHEVASDAVAREVERIDGRGDVAESGQIPFTPSAKKALEMALREALSLGHNYVGVEHILLGLLRGEEGVAARILTELADRAKMRDDIIGVLTERRSRRNPERWLEYQLCKRRGHVPDDRSSKSARPICRYCRTTFWEETVKREEGAPPPPVPKADQAPVRAA